jgi:gliding motility-associated-like protein
LGAENASSSELIIFNRYNNIIYQSKSFRGNGDRDDNDCTGWWDGTASGKELPAGTYFYQLTLNGDRVYKGYVVLKK